MISVFLFGIFCLLNTKYWSNKKQSIYKDLAKLESLYEKIMDFSGDLQSDLEENCLEASLLKADSVIFATTRQKDIKEFVQYYSTKIFLLTKLNLYSYRESFPLMQRMSQVEKEIAFAKSELMLVLPFTTGESEDLCLKALFH